MSTESERPERAGKPAEAGEPPLPAPDGPLVACSGVGRAYGSGAARTVALEGVDLDIARGEVVAVIGPSGCGKSTLLHILGAMDRPDEGRVLFDGRDIGGLDDAEASRYRREEIGVVFQFFNLIPTLDVVDNVALPARLAGVPARAARERAGALLARVGLADRQRSFPDVLSGGEQQRVAVARALVNRPRLVLGDEPTGALDTRSGAAVLELLGEIVREAGVTLIIATHSDAAVAIADRIVRLEDGRVRAVERSPLRREIRPPTAEPVPGPSSRPAPSPRPSPASRPNGAAGSA